ncbi:PilZ domain-containing protein [Thiorhodococcus minor]|uniref:PilZ domain-containing protein n=1 Tax=Thiorhodococcus minor TaxID=57489 RepID=A0A6M0K5B4_9GAMM|nr:PilZ domain-containing protein [Thiorhodococcus minor]NEV64444.1 hypothetical protein [Thiorhodococcus minor]
MRESVHSSRTINRRRYFRRSDSCEVQVQAIDAAPTEPGGRSSPCISCDISPAGMRVLADRAHPVGSRVLLAMECRENGWIRIISRVGSVVWTKVDATDERCQLGIRFEDVDSPELAAIGAIEGFH